jgi:hypothetical protein
MVWRTGRRKLSTGQGAWNGFSFIVLRRNLTNTFVSDFWHPGDIIFLLFKP